MKFSICVPVYKTGKYLKTCIDSVTCQDFNDYEIIIVDDGSPDDSGKIADDMAKYNSKIKVIHQENKGLFHARISAMKIAVGDYVISLDSDDWLEDGSLKIISDAIDKYEADVVIFNNYQCTENAKKKKTVFDNKVLFWDSDNKDEFIKSFFTKNALNQIWRKAIKRQLLKLDLLSEMPRITMTEDWIHSYYPVINAKKIVYIPDALYNYRYNQSSMTKVFDPRVFLSAKIIYELKKEYVNICDTSLTLNDVNEQFLIKISKMLVYEPGRVKNKEIYYDFVKEIKNDELAENVYRFYSRKLQLLYKVPLKLLFKEKYKQLLLFKKGVSKIRSVIKR